MSAQEADGAPDAEGITRAGAADGVAEAAGGTGRENAGTPPRVVIGILGPTGVGKTAVAVQLARLLAEAWPSPTASGRGAHPGEGLAADRVRVISCDSMQVYRGFPVLTNQPAAGEGEGVSHELVGFVEPEGEFSAAQYAGFARPLIEAGLSSRGWALMVGGAGLYMRAALAPLAVASEADPELRARLEARATAEGLDALYAELERLDPAAARAIDLRNRRRVIRALEAVTLTGQRWSGRSDLWTPAYYHPTLLVGLVAERTELYDRIDLRAERMLRQGAVEEVRRFREARGPEETRPGGAGIRSAIGYPEVCRYLDGDQTLEETVTQVAAATRRYARRQLTWLRKLEDAVIIDAQDRDSSQVAEEILILARSGDRTRESHRS